MPLIRNGRELADIWTFLAEPGDPADIAPDAPVSLPLAAFLEAGEAWTARPGPLGVRLAPGDDPETLAPHLGHLALIEIAFPKYTDGRGYSQAQLLRRRHRYQGELRAVGQVLRDQVLYMHRSGFDAFVTERADLASVLEALTEVSAYYQPAADRAPSVFALRAERKARHAA